MSATEILLKSALDNAWQGIYKSDTALALEHAKKASQIAPDAPEVAHVLGVIASRDYRHDIALPLLQKALDGGLTERRLRDMAEALLLSGHPQAALTPIQDCLKHFGASAEALGLLAAIQTALNQFEAAEQSATQAVALKPHLMAWDSTVAFCQLMQLQIATGFAWFTGRAENLAAGSRCPALQFATPCEIYLKNEEGPGDTLFYLRFAAYLVKQGFSLHLKTDKKTKALLNATGLFASVKEDLTIPHGAFWLNMGDLPLAAIQRGCEPIANALPLSPDPARVAKLQKKLSAFGPAPYVAVTWRAGARGRRVNQGIRRYHKHIDPEAMGSLFANRSCTIISVQRVPEADEKAAFRKGLGRDFADFSACNDQLQDMLALMSLVDDYVTVPNTNVHIRQSLCKPMQVLVNQPWQDWRWLPDGNSPWYPNAKVYRQSDNGDWTHALQALAASLLGECAPETNAPSSITSQATSPTDQTEQNAHATQSLTQAVLPAWEHLKKRQLPEAIKIAQGLMAEYPNHPEVLHLLGWAAHLDLKTDIAIALLKKAHEGLPDDITLLANLVRAMVFGKQYPEAEQLLTEYLTPEVTRHNCSLLSSRAYLYLQQNRLHEAVADYQAYLTYDPNNLEISSYLGALKLKIGDANTGFRLSTARKEARLESRIDDYVCPSPYANYQGAKILIKRDMGLGDELTFLRYLPWLTQAGAEVTYWAGKKLAPVLSRLGLANTILPDSNPAPNKADFDLTFWVNELPIAVQRLGAPDIAPPLPLSAREDLIQKWSSWLASLGPGPYIGFNWRAGAMLDKTALSFGKLSKEIAPFAFANALSGVRGTFVSLQRNVTLSELHTFEQALKAPVHDATAITDELEDLIALLSLLDENIGVSNTNMHLRAGLGMGSSVLVQHIGDWRWGYESGLSLWFTESRVYRQSDDGEWNNALDSLRKSLLQRYGHAQHVQESSDSQLLKRPDNSSKKILWVSAGEVKDVNGRWHSELNSAVERVIAPAKGLINFGWESHFIHESMANVMGGWQGKPPEAGDIVIFSKVVTEHALVMAKDAQARGALVVVDVFNDFKTQPDRERHQFALMAHADAIVSIPSMTKKWQNAGKTIDAYIENIPSDLGDEQNVSILEQWNVLLSGLTKKTTPVSIHPFALKRVLVGMLYSGEQEYQQAVEALRAQSHANHELIEFKYLPNKQAHDALYDAFMQRASDFDFFLKLDADMVFAHEHVLAEMVEHMSRNKLAHLFAYVKDCPSDIMIPGIQMFRSDTRWLGSQEQLNVDYPPKLLGKSTTEVDKHWILHMPAPSHQQLFRYGIHKALKSLQRGVKDKTPKKTILHISILTGIYRQLCHKPDNIWALMGSTLVFTNVFNGIEYNGSLMQDYFESLGNEDAYNQLLAKTKQFWNSEVQVVYKWLDLLKADEKATALPLPSNRSSKTLYWITAGKLETTEGFVNSRFASTRYRVLLPAANLGPLGWQSQVIHEEGLAEHGWQQTPLKKDDIVIVSKSHAPAILAYIQQAKALGCTIIADFCDNHFLRPDAIGQHQHALLDVADLIVTTTPELAAFIQNLTHKRVTVITDCFEGTKQAAHFNPNQALKLLWFGSHTNLDTLKSVYSCLLAYAKKRPITLELVTKLEKGDQVVANLTNGALTVTYTPWTQQALQDAFNRCDIVIIPTIDTDQKAGKSPNRMIEAIWAGRYVIAGDLPAYRAFASYASVGEPFAEALDWALEHPEEVKNRIKLGQAYIAHSHTPKQIGEQWHLLLSQASHKEIALPNSKANSADLTEGGKVPTSLKPASSESVEQIQSLKTLQKLAIITSQSPSLPSIAIRLIEPFGLLEEYGVAIASGLDAQNKLQIDFEALLMRDTIIVQRDAANADTLPLIRKLKQLGKKIIYETDDAFHLLPEHHPKAFHRSKAPAMMECAKLADAITVSTQALADEFSPFGRVHVVPNLLSQTLWQPVQSKASLAITTNRLRIGLVGGSNHRDDFAMIKLAVEAIAKQYPEITWVAYGESAINLFKQIPACTVESHATNYNYPSHPARLAQLALDIALVPLEDNAFNRCISNLKYLEYGYLGVPAIYSNVEAYRNDIIDQHNGILVDAHAEAWISAIQRLIDQPELRTSIAQHAQEDVSQYWMLTPEYNPWKRVLESL